ncbi:HipA domain-containing protein [Anaerotignum faecicola]|nr:HipA domain-containing protein [Anaerotignum faecicola]
MMKYILMHREIEVAEIELDELSHITNIYEVYAEEHFPVGTLGKHGVDKTMLAKWWAKRSIPASRSGIRETLDLLHMSVPQELLAKCYGLSLSDQYWISPKDKPLMWKEINFFDHDFSEDVGNLLFGYGEFSDSMSLISPDNTSDGQLIKKWKIADGKRVLIKGGSNPYQQEPLCEVIASQIAERLCIPHTKYTLLWEHEKPFSVCQDFITSETELVSAYHIMQSRKKPNDLSDYEFYLSCVEQLGVKNIREQTEKMVVLDFLIGNEDRHFNNFGLIRNAVTLEWIGVAPIFDCGTSLWYNTQESLIKPLSPNLPAKPFKKTHREQIKLVKDFSWIDLKALDGMKEEIEEILSQSPYISRERRAVLCHAFCQRAELLGEIANEHTIKEDISQENDMIF